MTRKKRMFDIEMPEDEQPNAGPGNSSLVPGAKRRGPMASAIAENAGALTARADAEAKIRAENDALAHEYVAIKRAGKVIRHIPLDDVMTEALVRDRKKGPDEALPELVTSVREVGLSNPIRVEERSDGKYELVQGYRRLSAYRELAVEDAEKWGAIPGVILPRGEGQASLYRQMIDENLIRKDISFAEMALTAQAYAADPQTAPDTVDRAVKELFRSANYQRRSYIRAFARLMDALGSFLVHPEAISRNLGLALWKRIEQEQAVVRQIRDALSVLDERTPEAEIAVLRAALDAAPKPAVTSPKAAKTAGTRRRPRTTFEFGQGAKRVRCVAGVGQLLLKLDRDLTAVDRQKLEHGIARLLDSLD